MRRAQRAGSIWGSARRLSTRELPTCGREKRLAVGPLVKAADRFHNHSSMGNAFSVAKQLSYLRETEELVLPMIKAASRLFPLQEAAFENAKLALRSQISLARPALQLAETLAARAPAPTEPRPQVKP